MSILPTSSNPILLLHLPSYPVLSYPTAILPHPTSSYTAFFCHLTPSYSILSHPTLPYPTHPTPHPTLSRLPTQSYVVFYCHCTSHPTLSYSILPHLITSYLVLPCPTLSYSIPPSSFNCTHLMKAERSKHCV